jgi:hypothetical protein
MNLDMKFNGQAFRRDFVEIIAQNRHLATIGPVCLKNDAAGYVAGVVLALNSVSGLFEKYVNGGSSGTGTAVCVNYQPVSYPEDFGVAGTGTAAVQAVFGGELLQAKLTGLDSTAITSLVGRSFTDATGIQVFKF